MKKNSITRLAVCWVFLMTLFYQKDAFAQLACNNPDPNMPGQLSPGGSGGSCIATVDAATAVMSGVGPFTFTARTFPGGVFIASGSPFVSIPVGTLLNTVIKIEVTDGAMNTCDSYFLVQDKQSPVFTNCPASVNVVCTASLAPVGPLAVTVTDNCDINLTVGFIDSAPSALNCPPSPASGIIRTITRTWTATDASGNPPATCVQTINILEATSASVVFPSNVTFDCATFPANADPTVSGRPTIMGNPIGFLCNFSIGFSDATSFSGCGERIITRTWFVDNECTSVTSIQSQIISFTDTTAPQFTCPGPQSVSTATGLCTASVTLPTPVVTDNCSTPFTLTVNTVNNGGTPFNMSGFNLANVPVGLFTVTYTATDDCGNSSTCTTSLTVTDTETPTAVCDGDKIVAVPYPSGIATLLAAAFNVTSFDNCSPVNFSVSRDGNPFGPTVTFTCADVGNTVMVVLRVREVINPNSFTDCMTLVMVQDKVAPVFLFCPADLTIDCETDYSDLGIFGTPIVEDNCSFTLVEQNPTNTVNNCGVGTITRRWLAVDPSSNPAQCIQVITVADLTPYDGSTIQWPENYTAIDQCVQPTDLLPVDLPTSPINYSVPVVPGTSACRMIATSYSDQVFDVAIPACYKIVRTWKVMDWCQYNSANPTVGIWTHQQIIAVMDTQAPVPACPANTVVNLNNSCTFGTVVLSPVTATDCSPDITITNNSPYATSNGADASGNYPVGVHTVTFTIKDGCGNQSTCRTVVTVRDGTLPTPYCNTGIVGELQSMNGGPVMATIQATQLNFNSFDNCTSQANLKFTIQPNVLPGPPPPSSPPPTTSTSLTFDCTQIGEHQVELWVTDLAGNSDYCITEIIIQDNMNLCPPPPPPGPPEDPQIGGMRMIAGEIETETGDLMPGVNVQISNAGMAGNTDNSGSYEFHDLSIGGNYAVVAQKDADARNGVSTFDLVLMGRHVLGITPLASPYKIIAADVNKSGAVTTADMVELRKLILHIYDQFPNNTSWRFVDKNYVFPNPGNPFTPGFPEVVHVMNIDQDVLDANFVGVKIGDLNCSATTNFTGDPLGDRNGNESLALTTEDRALEAGEEFTVPFRINDIDGLLALQFTLEFETDDLDLQGIEKGVLPGPVEEVFGMSLLDEGILTTGWFHLKPVQVGPEDVLFSLRFRAKKAGVLRDFMSMTSRFTEAAVYDGSEKGMKLNLAYLNSVELNPKSAFQLFQNQPNPFKKMTSIGFSLPETSPAKLTVYDLSGRVLKSFQQTFNEGYNEVSIERNELPSAGVLYYQLETPAQTATKKMILLQ